MFNGLLITVGTYNIPLKYMKAETYKAPLNVQDLDTYTDANGVLHRNALDHVPVKVEFETMPLNNTQLEDLFSNIKANYTVQKERKATCIVYAPEIDDYVNQDMYMVQPEPLIDWIDLKTNTIYYKPFRLAFVGY